VIVYSQIVFYDKIIESDLISTEETIRLLQHEKNVSFMPNSIVKAINGTSKLESLAVTDTKATSSSSSQSLSSVSSESKLDMDGVFVEWDISQRQIL
jgi:thioredoxin reductase